jgi:hypothetical protein
MAVIVPPVGQTTLKTGTLNVVYKSVSILLPLPSCVCVQRNKVRMQCVLTNEVLILVEPEKLLRRSAQYRIELTHIFNVNRRVGRGKRVCTHAHADLR